MFSVVDRPIRNLDSWETSVPCPFPCKSHVSFLHISTLRYPFYYLRGTWGKVLIGHTPASSRFMEISTRILVVPRTLSTVTWVGVNKILVRKIPIVCYSKSFCFDLFCSLFLKYINCLASMLCSRMTERKQFSIRPSLDLTNRTQMKETQTKIRNCYMRPGRRRMAQKTHLIPQVTAYEEIRRENVSLST